MKEYVVSDKILQMGLEERNQIAVDIEKKKRVSKKELMKGITFKMPTK